MNMNFPSPIEVRLNMVFKFTSMACLSAVFLAHGEDRRFEKMRWANPNETAKADFWYRISFDVNSNDPYDMKSVESSSHTLALRCLRTCLRLDQSSATCHTQIGALMSSSSNSTEQLLALPHFNRAAQLQPSVR